MVDGLAWKWGAGRVGIRSSAMAAGDRCMIAQQVRGHRPAEHRGERPAMLVWLARGLAAPSMAIPTPNSASAPV